MTVRVYGYKGTSQVASGGGGGGAPSGPAGGDLAGSYPNPSVDKVLGGVIPVSAECVGTNGSGQFVATACGAALTYYLQNSSVASGTYTSGGSLSGTGTCNLAITGGGGSGATATVPVTGGAIAGGTPLTITNVGTQFTSAPTAATFGSCTGTATSSGSAVIATVLDGLPSDVSGAYPMLATPYNPVTKAAYAMSTGSGTTNEQTWATTPGQPNLGFIPAGGYICHIHQSRTNAFTGTAVTQCAFQEVDSSGAFIATIGTTDVSGNIGLTEHAETLEYDDPNVYTMASTSSRVAVIVQLVQTSVGASGTLNLYVGGEADAHIILPAVQPPNTIDGVSFCTGFTPTNGQYLQYTTASSPNPCWTAATVTVPTIASTTQTLKGDGSGNASGIGSSSTDCVHPDGSSGACIASSATTVNGQTCTLGSTCTTGGYLGAPIGNSPTSNAILYGDASGNLQNAAGITRTGTGQLTLGTAGSPGNEIALGTAATDSASLGSELTTSGTCTGTGWTGTYPNYVAPGTTNPLTCTGFTSGMFYQTVTTIGAGGSGAVTIAIGTAQTASGSSGTVTAGLKANGTSLTYTPVSTYTGTIGISAKLITPISMFTVTGKDSTGAVSGVVLWQTLASLHNSFSGGGGSYNTTGSYNSAQGFDALYSNTTGSYNSAQGVQALYSNTTGSSNSAQGVHALYSNTTGTNNSAQGYYALYSNTTGTYNSAQGVPGPL